MNTSTSQAVSDARQRDIIKKPARLEVTGNRPLLQVPPRATGLNTTGGNTNASAPRRTSKRILADLEADRAATEITDLVEQEGHHIIGSKRRLPNSEQKTEHAPQNVRVISVVTTSASDHDSYHQRADQEDDKVVAAIDDPISPDDSEIPEWVIAESKALSREITNPEQLSSGIKGSVKMVTVARQQSLERYTSSAV
jgi:hypothetical protein